MAHVVITRPSEDLNRYLVDKFYPSAKQAKQTFFESIDLTAYKASAKCVSFCTSESRLPLWVRVFAMRNYEILNGDTGYRVTWNEHNGSNSPYKCERIVILYSLPMKAQKINLLRSLFLYQLDDSLSRENYTRNGVWMSPLFYCIQ